MKYKIIHSIVSLTACLLFTMVAATASEKEHSRAPEVEDYLTAKASAYLSSILPGQPHSVIVHVEPRRKAPPRSEAESMTSLPYLTGGPIAETYDDWSNKDVSVEALIEEVKTIEIELSLPSGVSESQIATIKKDLFSKLRLQPARDKFTVSKQEWAKLHEDKPDLRETPQAKESRATETFRYYALLAVAVGFFVWLWFLFRNSVSVLVQGIKSVGADIAKRADSPTPSPLVQQPNSASTARENERVVNSNESSISGSVKEIAETDQIIKDKMASLKDLFAAPRADVMEILEEEGSRHPDAIGKLLSELDSTQLEQVFQYSSGDWWFSALTGSKADLKEAFRVADRIERIRQERQIVGKLGAISEQDQKLALLLVRLNTEALITVFTGLRANEAFPALRLLRMPVAVAVSKALFPKDWSSVLNTSEVKTPISPETAKTLSAQAIAAKPLHNPEELRTIFKDVELMKFLDAAPPHEEREIYQGLPMDSLITSRRRPFFEVLELTPGEILGIEVSLQDWGAALHGVSPDQFEKFIAAFTERQRYFINEFRKSPAGLNPGATAIRKARAAILSQAPARKPNHFPATASKETSDHVQAIVRKAA